MNALKVLTLTVCMDTAQETVLMAQHALTPAALFLAILFMIHVTLK